MAKKITQNVNKDKVFNDEPIVRPDMSRWITRHTNYQSCNMGQIVPIYYDEVLPGESRKITLGMISHTTTPIAPIFPAMYTEVRCFAVPLRLCADLLNGYKDRKSPFVKVFGEDNASAESTIVVPLADQKLPDLAATFVENFETYCTGTHPDNNVFDSLDLVHQQDYSNCNFLNLAAYELIYQRHYRNENYESSTESDLYKFLFNAYNTELAEDIASTYSFEVANREKDYFTGAKPFTQKGDPVRVGLGNEADLKAVAGTEAFIVTNEGDELGTFPDGGAPHLSGDTELLGGKSADVNLYITDFNSDYDNGRLNINPASLKVDLKNATGISIEELRLLIKTQELLEKDAIYGSRYAESLNAHFGCCPLDLTLQDPQELYRTTITSNMQAIFQTSATKDETSILGTIGANSTTQVDPFVILPETKFYEHCILMICAVHKLQNVYDTRWFKPKFLFKQSRFDFYTPELNDLGYQPVTNNEMVKGSAVVGYNEAFAEYRYKFNKSHGALNKDFLYWAPAISDDYGSISALYKQGVEELDKALSVHSTTAPQFYDAWGFEEVNTKPMSLHSIPGFDGVI